jgi:hypothetical protein
VPAAATAPAGDGMVQLAETGRELPQEKSAPAHEPGEVEPDLDHLARQVYQLLKHRLAAERRRSS